MATTPPAFDVPAVYVDSPFRLDGRAAFGTVGGSWLVAAMAKGLAQAGAAVAIVDVNEQGAAATVQTIEEQGGRAVSLPCDVTSKQEVDALADRVVDELGSADVLVNSAGTAFRAPAEEFPEEEFD